MLLSNYIYILALTLMLAVGSFAPQSVLASDDVMPPKKHDWEFQGAFGKFDYASIQRGFQVYKEVCSACHSLKRVAFRNLAEVGFTEDEIKALASEYSIVDGPDESGEMFERAGKPADYFPPPYPNENAARAANNNNALPPDLSLITKARHDGPSYVYSLLTGYQTPPEGFELGANMYYNPYFAGGGRQFSMIPPLTDNIITYQDESIDPKLEQMAHDVVNFLQWAAEPEMEKRKLLGFKVLVFLAIFTILFYLLKNKIWKRVK